ncbi:MAG: HD-GYP domain-containing protein, partial [Burkholderiaceae bacterium]
MSVLPHTPGGDPVRRYQIPVDRLRRGMFVVELDRPWPDTPFLLQGFLIDSQIELETLRRYCRYVYVDIERSTPALSELIQRAEVGDRRAQRLAVTADGHGADDGEPAARPGRSRRPVRIRADVKITSQTRERFRHFIKATAIDQEQSLRHASPLRRAAGWLRAQLSAPARHEALRAVQLRSQQAVRAALPLGLRLHTYRERVSFAAALPRARAAFAQAEQALCALQHELQAGRPLELDAIQAAVERMVDSMIEHPDPLPWVARLREDDDSTPYPHGVKTAMYLLALGRHLGLPVDELRRLGLAGLLADIGKARLPRALLEKPGMLNPSEYGVMKEHVRLGLEALKQTSLLHPDVEQAIAQHHERLDGSGYPKGLRGDEIGIWGRMAAIADSFCALTAARSYANPCAPQDAAMNLYEWSGSSFDEALVEQFILAVGLFPVGCLVELSNGQVALVRELNRVRRLEPRVLVLTDRNKVALAMPIELDLAEPAAVARPVAAKSDATANLDAAAKRGAASKPDTASKAGATSKADAAPKAGAAPKA